MGFRPCVLQPEKHETFDAVRHMISLVEDAQDALREYARFADASNIAGIAAWATADEAVPGKFRAEGRVLLDEERQLRLEPNIVPKVPTPAVATMREAVGRI